MRYIPRNFTVCLYCVTVIRSGFRLVSNGEHIGQGGLNIILQRCWGFVGEEGEKNIEPTEIITPVSLSLIPSCYQAYNECT